MTAIPIWLKGRHWTAMTFTPQNVAADGTLSDSVALACIALVRSCRLTGNPAKENISPVTSSVANMEILEENNTFECEVLMQRGVNPLADIAATSDIVKAVATWGGGTGGVYTWTFYGSRGAFETGIQSKGSNTERLTLDQVDIGSANPALVIT